MAEIHHFPDPTGLGAFRLAARHGDTVQTRNAALEAERAMVTAALKSWMDGDPLTQREHRIVETVLDTNYFGQLGRLAMGG
jgi:hypothetical protein